MIEIKRILAPTDFSPHSQRAVRYACALAEKSRRRAAPGARPLRDHPGGPRPAPHARHAPSVLRGERGAGRRETLEKLLDPAWGKPAVVTTAVRWGSPVEAIVDYARDEKIELIVIATHGRTGLSHVLLGSVAERIVREAPCPVLTIRDPESRGPGHRLRSPSPCPSLRRLRAGGSSIAA